jgi:antitoxin (DNA-binding transcriptional repressor) of toxin-antitoxin stability system
MTSNFWSNDPKDNHRIFRGRKGRMVIKIVSPGGVVAIIGADIPVTTITALKHKIHSRILARREARQMTEAADVQARERSQGDEASED